MAAHSPTHRRVPIRATRPTNVSLDSALVAEAKALGVNISSASSRGLEQAVTEARAQRWLAANEVALAASNDHVEANGLPLNSLRRF